MGSVIDYNAECPFCGGINGIDDFYYKTGEAYFNKVAKSPLPLGGG